MERPKGCSLMATKRYADEGETFRFTAIPDEGYELETLSGTHSQDREVDLTGEGGGRYSLQVPARAAEIQASFRETDAQPLPFSDVPENAWYAVAVR